MDDDRAHKPMNRKQRLAARHQEPLAEERTVGGAVLAVLGLFAAVIFAAIGVFGLAAGEGDGSTVILCFALAVVGLGVALPVLAKRRPRG